MSYEFKWDFMDIGAFHYAHVAKWTVIGCLPSEWIYWCHSLDSDWLLAQWMDILVYIYTGLLQSYHGLSTELLPILFFVSQLDASWGHSASKCCYYCCLFCTLEQWLLQCIPLKLELWLQCPKDQQQSLNPTYLDVKTFLTVTFIVGSLKTINKLPKLTASTAEHNIGIICAQEQRYYHSELQLKYHVIGSHLFQHLHGKTPSKEGEGMLLRPCVLKSLNNTEKTQMRIMCATFNGNPWITTVFCCSLTNASDEMDITTFYNRLSSLAQHIPKHNILIISTDMNTQIGNDENNKFGLHNLPSRNSEYLANFSPKNSLSYLNTKFQKRGGGKLWTKQ